MCVLEYTWTNLGTLRQRGLVAKRKIFDAYLKHHEKKAEESLGGGGGVSLDILARGRGVCGNGDW